MRAIFEKNGELVLEIKIEAFLKNIYQTELFANSCQIFLVFLLLLLIMRTY